MPIPTGHTSMHTFSAVRQCAQTRMSLSRQSFEASMTHLTNRDPKGWTGHGGSARQALRKCRYHRH